MDLHIAADALKELGHPTRLSIFKALVKSGHQGLPVGEIQKQLDIPASTLSHHLSALLSVGLIQQVREGRVLYCQPQYPLLQQLIAFLVEACCTGEKNGEMSPTSDIKIEKS